MTDNTAAAQDNTGAATTGDQSGADEVKTALGGDAPADATASDTAASDGKTDGAGDNAEGNDGEGGEGGDEGGGDNAGDPAPFDPAKLELPEGWQVNEGLMAEFTPLAAELGLNQETGQKLIEMHTKALQSVHEGYAKAFGDTVQGWAESAKTDKEIGGDKYNENVVTALKAINRFGTPELQKALNESGLGNHPELIRFCLRIGKAISEDSFGPGEQQGGGGTEDVASRLYPNQAKKQ